MSEQSHIAHTHLPGLETDSFQSGSAQMCLVSEVGESYDNPTCVGLPIRSVQAREGRDKVHVTSAIC